MAKQALGKGLGALIKRPGSGSATRAGAEPKGGKDDAAEGGSGERVRLIERDKLIPSPLQPRKQFRDDQLDELVESIRQHGVIQPLIARSVSGRLELIAGERRWRASERLGLREVPVIVRTASDRDVLEMALIENLQREDLNPIEEAEAFVRLAREFDLKQEDIARRVGKNRATVANSMRLLDLQPDVRQLVAHGQLSAGHAKALLGERDAERQKLLATRIIKKGLTVRDTERAVADTRPGPGPGKKGGAKGKLSRDEAAAVAAITSKLRERLGTHVAVHHGAKKGKIEIEYYGNDDLDRILELLGVSLSDD